MKLLRLYCCLLILVIAVLSSCAKRGTPDGGAIDVLPPEYVRARPENFTTNFDAQAIEIYFDEYIKLQDPQKQIIISPPMDPPPEIIPLGTASRSIQININDTLQPNTTYTVNFGRSIIDNNEGNPLSFFTYAFSTGAYIDSLTVAGSVADGLMKLPDPYISVMLYEVDSTYSDSVVYQRMPRYVTNTLDSATTFQLNNLKEGRYQMVALKDVNNNYLFDPETDKIAFADEVISLPTESVFDLILFRERLEEKFLRPQQVGQQHLVIGYQGEIQPDSIDFQLLKPQEDIEYRVTKDIAKDSLHFWFKPQLTTDTISLLLKRGNFRDTLMTRYKEMDQDSLSFKFTPSGNLNYNEPVRIQPTIPLLEVKDSLISVVANDSLSIPYEISYDQWKNELSLAFEKKEKFSYSVSLLPGAVEDFLGNTNDSISKKFQVPALADLGNLTINLEGVEEFPVILQLTDEEGVVYAEKYSTGDQSVNFEFVRPGPYYLRLVYDENKNKRWDTGKFLDRRQPERVVYYPEEIEVRANWDDVYTFMVN